MLFEYSRVFRFAGEAHNNRQCGLSQFVPCTANLFSAMTKGGRNVEKKMCYGTDKSSAGDIIFSTRYCSVLKVVFGIMGHIRIR